MAGIDLAAIKRAAQGATHAIVFGNEDGSTERIGGEELRALVRAAEALRQCRDWMTERRERGEVIRGDALYEADEALSAFET